MQWTDLEWVPARKKVARPSSASDLLASSGSIVIFPVGTTLPPYRDGVWVTASAMPETVKRVDADGLVVETVPREHLELIGFPAIVPASLARQASDPGDLLRRALATGEARAFGSPP